MQSHGLARAQGYARTLRAIKSLCAVLVFGLVAQAGVSKTVTVEYRFFPGLATMTGNWAALKAASDGKVYVGLACNGCDGYLVF
jgi:hypothetical protein